MIKMKQNNIQKFTYKNCDVEIRSIINPDTKYWCAEYKIIEEYPEGTRFRGFIGKKEFPNKIACLNYYKKLAILNIEND